MGSESTYCTYYEPTSSGLAGFTPEHVFTGRYIEVAEQKQQGLNTRYELNPERFVKEPPMVTMPPKSVAINPIDVDDESSLTDCVNFPTLTTAGYKPS